MVNTCPLERTGPEILLRPFTKSWLPSQAGYWQKVSTWPLPRRHQSKNYTFHSSSPPRVQQPLLSLPIQAPALPTTHYSGGCKGGQLSLLEWSQKTKALEEKKCARRTSSLPVNIVLKGHWKRVRLGRNKVVNWSLWCKNKSPFVKSPSSVPQSCLPGNFLEWVE